jgi:hypothetical protein
MQILFENTGTADKNFDATLTVKTLGSVDIPVVDRMIKNKQINGFIKTTAADKKSVDMWPFKIITD